MIHLNVKFASSVQKASLRSVTLVSLHMSDFPKNGVVSPLMFDGGYHIIVRIFYGQYGGM
jgi:hypothetical protein